MNKIIKDEEIIIDGTYVMEKPVYITKRQTLQSKNQSNDFFKEGNIIEMREDSSAKKLNGEVIAVANSGKYIVIKLLRK
jgi:hypothetical protein